MSRSGRGDVSRFQLVIGMKDRDDLGDARAEFEAAVEIAGDAKGRVVANTANAIVAEAVDQLPRPPSGLASSTTIAVQSRSVWAINDRSAASRYSTLEKYGMVMQTLSSSDGSAKMARYSTATVSARK